MRTVSAMVAFLVLILAIGWWSSHTLDSSADKLYKEVKSIQIALKHIESTQEELPPTQWNQAQSSISKLDKMWIRTRSQWMILVDHRELDSIETSLARLNSYIKSKDVTLSKSELANLLLLIKHIPEKEAVNIRNIL